MLGAPRPSWGRGPVWGGRNGGPRRSDLKLRLPLRGDRAESSCARLPQPPWFSPCLVGRPRPVLQGHGERPGQLRGGGASWGRGGPGQAQAAPGFPVTSCFPSSPAHLAAFGLFPVLFLGSAVSSPSPRLWRPGRPQDSPFLTHGGVDKRGWRGGWELGGQGVLTDDFGDGEWDQTADSGWC